MRFHISRKKGIIFLVLAAGIVFGGSHIIFGHMAQKQVDAIVSKYDRYVHISYDQVSITLFGFDPKISGVTIQNPFRQGESLRIKDVVVSDYAVEEDGSIPTRLSVHIEDLVIPRTVFSTQRQKELDDLGYGREVPADVDVDFAYDKEKGSIRLDECRVHIEKAFALSLSLQINDFDPQELQTYFLVYLLRPERIPVTIAYASLTYTDDAFFERMLTWQAEDEGIPKDELVRTKRNRLARRLEETKNPYMQKLLRACMDFLQERNTFEVRTKAETPVRIGEAVSLWRQNRILDLLDLFQVGFET